MSSVAGGSIKYVKTIIENQEKINTKKIFLDAKIFK
jgi:hypothetical protein